MKKISVPGVPGSLSFVKSLTSAVTTSWGVGWDETYIARDLMQNFFDANRDRLADVKVSESGPDVIVTAPTPFQLERLFYLGSEKGPDDIGQYGEGFKAAAVCLLRDHSVTPVVASGQDVVALRVSDDVVSDTKLRPIRYDFYRTDRGIAGCALILQGCSGKLKKALQAGMTHFFSEQNPLLGGKRWASWDRSFAIYTSADTKGHVFYRNLKRGEIPDIPVVLVINKEYAKIEKKIKHDRDRNAFGEELMQIFYEQFARSALRQNTDAQRVIVELARNVWTRGHPLLSEIADVAYGGWNAKNSKEVFGDRYYARSTSRSPAEQLQFEGLERRWKEEGREPLASYFSRFGILNAQAHVEDSRRKAVEEAKLENRRPPSQAEMSGIALLTATMRGLAPEVSTVFHKRSATYTVAKTDAILGALKDGRTYGSREVFLAAKVFTADFAHALAVFLHEHSHIFGFDGSRGFSDALTELLESTVRHRKELDRFEDEWDANRRKVLAEREEGQEADSLHDWLAEKDERQLRDLLRRIPPVILEKFRDER